MISQPTDRCSPRCHCCPLLFIKTERGGKKNGEKTLRLDNFAVLSLTFFQLNCHFWGERARSMISLPTDQCSPRHHCRPLVFNKTERGCKKNGEKTSCLDNFAVYSLTFFQLNCLYLVECAINDIAAHRPMFAPLPLLPT